MGRTFTLRFEGDEYRIEQQGRAVLVNGKRFETEYSAEGITVGESAHKVEIRGSAAYVDGIAYTFETEGLEAKKAELVAGADRESGDADGAIAAIMPGLIIKVLVDEGDPVAAGDVVVVLEAMKMENEICSPRAGVVKELRVKEGDSVQQNQLLALVE